MLLKITTTHKPATDLGYLLAKHPDKCQSFKLSYGKAHVFYPEAREDICTAVLLLDLDTVGLVRGRRNNSAAAGTLAQYVNDRPYVASSFFSVAIAQVFASALKGQSKGRQQLAETPIPLNVEIPVLPCRGGEGFLRGLFEPLGYEVAAISAPLDEKFPEWGEGPYFTVTLAATCKLKDLLTHLYVLLPVLDNNKHYWVGSDEIENLLSKGEGWLAVHPLREVIASRYLKHRKNLIGEAMQRLVAEDDPDPEETEEKQAHEEEALEEKISLNDQRLGTVAAVLREAGAKRVIDLGCGEGGLIKALLKHRDFTYVAGVDVSCRALEIAKERLRLDSLSERQRNRVGLFQGSLTYRDKRFAGFDAACAVEVIEHIDISRLKAFERVLFEFAAPQTIVVSTPNIEYNVCFENLPEGKLRHRDHRFEWTRKEFQQWAEATAEKYGYSVRFVPIGDVRPEFGAPTQMGIFTK